ncbi:hypothetical protein QQF64_031167, partial [Cirrhinus molitorella]
VCIRKQDPIEFSLASSNLSISLHFSHIFTFMNILLNVQQVCFSLCPVFNSIFLSNTDISLHCVCVCVWFRYLICSSHENSSAVGAVGNKRFALSLTLTIFNTVRTNDCKLLKLDGSTVAASDAVQFLVSLSIAKQIDCLQLARKEESVATFKGNEFFCYDLSMTPIQSSTDEITLSFRTLQRNGLMLHTGKSADYVNLSLKSGAVWLVINLGSGAFEALVEPVNGKFNDNAWHDVKVTRNLRQHSGIGHAM